MSEALAEVLEARPRRFRPYPEYKDARTKWLGEIPAHWEVRCLKHLSGKPIKNGLGEPGEHDNPDWPRYIRITDIAGPRSLREDTFRSLPPSVAATAPVSKGDLLLAAVGATFGKSYLHNEDSGPACYAGYLVKFSPGPRCDSRYIAYWTESTAYWDQVRSLVIQATIQNFSAARYRELTAPAPTIREQRSIAEFIDRETAAIDALVAKKERLIGLLHEKRTALITRAVTQGLDPNVPMKDSGVEWLGEIPAHWEVKRTKHVSTKIGSGKTPSGGAEVYIDEGTMLIRSQNVHFDGLRLDDVAYIDSQTDREMANTRVVEGDVLLNITGASLGRCCVARLRSVAANVNQHVCIIRPKPAAFDASFLASSLASEAVQAQIFNNEDGISRDALNFEQIGVLALCTPPLAEQSTIAAFLNRETARIDALVAKVRDAIARVNELRTALISAAVTGKIDVREEAE